MVKEIKRLVKNIFPSLVVLKKALEVFFKYLKGGKVFCRLAKKNRGKNIFVFPHKSLGDIYILGLFFAGQAKLFAGDFVLVVVGETCKILATALGFGKVQELPQKEMSCLVSYACHSLNLEKDLRVLHFAYRDDGNIYKLLNCSGLNFLQCYENLIFGERLCLEKQIAYKKISADLKSTLNLGERKTAVLAPYAKSLSSFEEDFWHKIICWLKQNGFGNIFTNCAVEEEQPLAGTKKLQVAIDEICGVLDEAEVFFSARSGLCDVVSATNCKKIIFYPKTSALKNAVEFYTLAQLPFARNFVEHVVDENFSMATVFNEVL